VAIFNAPIAQPDHQARAVKCALELDAYCERFRIENNKKGIPIGVTRIGVHSGPATIGNFGSQSRMDFTAVGDTVNAAARTEGLMKYFGTRICCTDTIVPKCPGMHFRVIGDVDPEGVRKRPSPSTTRSQLMRLSLNSVRDTLQPINCSKPVTLCD
jgi:class 3 adenylate cyclase